MAFSLFSRKKLFVSSGIQGTLVVRFAMYWALYHLALWHASFLYFFIRERIGQLTGTSVMRSVDQLYSHFLSEYTPLVVGACVMLPIVMYEVIRQTHRVAGLLVRFSHALKDLMAGKAPRPVKLRDGDLLTDFEKLFNEFIEFYQARKATTNQADPRRLDELLQLPEVASNEPATTVS